MRIYVFISLAVILLASDCIDERILIGKQSNITENTTTANISDGDIIPLKNYGKAPELEGIAGWINSQPLKIADLKGKVILVDFWTYTCINCIRTLPYLKSWHEKYRDKGLVIIGVHTPEFEFEKDSNNVKAAVEKFGIKYAVAQDNDYKTWRAYKNNYWPRKYNIDQNGDIRYDHIGEGAYDETEKVIQQLLSVKANMTPVTQTLLKVGTPEIYLGYKFARVPVAGIGFRPDQVVDYEKVNGTIARNVLYLEGLWKNNPDNMQSVGPGRLLLKYEAKDVNIVAGGSAEAEIRVDGLSLSDNKGADIFIRNEKSYVHVGEQRLYNLVSDSSYNIHTIEIIPTGNMSIYTFTFG